jgi:hypothetical protein
LRRLAAVVACSAALGASAQAHWYVQLDNDLGFETDRWYSSGIRVSAVRRHGDHERELGLLQEIYSPDVKGFRFGAVDRMPTARLLVMAARHDRDESRWQTLEIDVGVRGPSAGGREVTRLVHRLVHARDIDWSRQDKDRIDVQLVASRTENVLRAVNLNYGAVLGNELTFVHAGAEYRLGTRGANAPSTAVVRFAASPPPFGMGVEGCWSAFVAGSGRVVLQNKMLEQGYGSIGGAPTRRRSVARATTGFSWAWPGGIVTFAVVHESKEFAQQSRGHTFASLTGYVDF